MVNNLHSKYRKISYEKIDYSIRHFNNHNISLTLNLTDIISDLLKKLHFILVLVTQKTFFKNICTQIILDISFHKYIPALIWTQSESIATVQIIN